MPAAQPTGPGGPPRDPVADLREIAFRLERTNAATPRVRAFRTAADTIAALDERELIERVAAGTLTRLPGIGDTTGTCVAESVRGQEPTYLAGLPDVPVVELDEAGLALRRALRGDCHTHSDWSDGGSPVEEMALAAVRLGHEYLVLTDHSPRLTVANGLSADRLRRQLGLVERINAALPDGFRILTGIEVDILPDGSLDQNPELLARLDVVVGSVHSRLRDPEPVMTARMLAAVSNPYLSVLGHCTGRTVAARGTGDRGHAGRGARPPSTFDADAVFAACAAADKAIEINCRPDRLDPPSRLLRLAVDAGCRFAIDSDAHAPGQLDWLPYGCERAARAGIGPDRIVNTWPAGQLRDWARGHR